MSELSNAAQAGIILGVDKMRGFRAIAATVIARYASDLARGWQPDADAEAHLTRICRRWHLGDVLIGLHVSYRKDYAI